MRGVEDRERGEVGNGRDGEPGNRRRKEKV